MAVYPGRNAVVYLSTTASGTASNVLHLNKWSLNRQTDKIEVTSFGDTNKTYVQGLPDLKGSFEGFWDDTETKPFTAAASSDGCKIYLYPSSNITTKYLYGTAWLDCSIDTSVSGAVTLKGDFAAASSWYIGV
jgi:hypothetical protein